MRFYFSFFQPPRVLRCAAVALSALALCTAAYANSFGSLSSSVQMARDAKTAKITPHPGAQIPLNLKFINSHGKTVRLAQYFHSGRPVILDLINYQCWGVCGFVQTGVLKDIPKLSAHLGTGYDIVTVSFNPTDTVQGAADKKSGYVALAPKQYRRAIERHWHFLVEGKNSTNSAQVAKVIGFHYVWDPAIHMYDHEAAIYVLTPKGKIANYFFGIHYVPADLNLALVHAGDDRITNVFDQILLLCTQFNPNTGKYTPVALRVMTLAGVAIVIGLCSMFFALFWWERKHRQSVAQQPPQPQP